MKRSRQLLFLSVVILIFTSNIQVKADDSAHKPRLPGESDRCLVCGMFVSPFPHWLAQVIHEDGSVAFFDGAKDMFRYLEGREKYLPTKIHFEIGAIYVTDYYTTKSIPAIEAYYVVGSAIYGPMGSELVALKTLVDAEEFRKDHGASSIVRFEEVTPALLATL